jgi:hypothetical protein
LLAFGLGKPTDEIVSINDATIVIPSQSITTAASGGKTKIPTSMILSPSINSVPFSIVLDGETIIRAFLNAIYFGFELTVPFCGIS